MQSPLNHCTPAHNCCITVAIAAANIQLQLALASSSMYMHNYGMAGALNQFFLGNIGYQEAQQMALPGHC